MAIVTSESFVAAPLVVLKSSFIGSHATSSSFASTFARLAYASNCNRINMSSDWMPGQPRPAHLYGSSPGDFGFDPLGLAKILKNFDGYKESECIHYRWAMVVVSGVLLPAALGLGNWVDARKRAATPGGQATYLGNPVPWGTLPVILAIKAIAIAFVEAQRNNEADPKKRKYPGGPFDALGFSVDLAKLKVYKLEEIKNGRLALLAFVGFPVQATAYPGTGPLENLSSHLANPWLNNVANVLIPRSVL